MKCPQCQNDTVHTVELNIQNLMICSHCHYCFIPANQMMQFNRILFAPTKKAWQEWLTTRNLSLGHKATLACINHPEQSTERKKIPDYDHDCSQSSCCQTLHLSPTELLPILKMGERLQDDFETSYRTKKRFNPFVSLLGGFFKKDSSQENLDLESIQFQRKIRPLLEGKL